MRGILIILLLTGASLKTQAQANIIMTIAGKDSAGYCCDNGPATNAKLNVPEFICLDKFSNVYIADGFNNRIRKISASTGIITTIVGTGAAGYNGDSIPATSAEIMEEAVALDSTGNIYITDFGNQRVRKVDVLTGIITTVAGNGGQGSAGDGVLAIHAQLNNPVGLSVDKFGNIYIGDYSNNKVRRVDATTGIITTFAGVQGPSMYAGGFVGYSGDGGPATNAVLSGPIQVFADSVGNVYICDQWNHAIRKVDIVTKIITSIAGTGTAGHFGDGGLAIHAQLNQPCGMDMDKQGNIFIAEYGDGVIRKIDGATGIISTVAGTGALGFSGDGGPATNAQLRCGDVHIDSYGVVYIADEDNNRIRIVYSDKLAEPASPVLSKGEVKVFPNPATNELTVEYDFATNDDGIFQVSDIMGKVVAVQKLNYWRQREQLDIHSLLPGLYLYRVVQSGIPISTGKFVKD